MKELVEALVLEHPGVVVLFTDTSCRVADAVEPKLQTLLRERFPLLHSTVVSRTDSPELLAQWGVFAFPTVVSWFDGKETSRFVRTFSMDAVAEALERPYSLRFE